MPCTGARVSSEADGAFPGGTVTSRARWYRWVASLLLLGALVAATRALGEERKFAEVLRAARPAWLIAIATLQGATYVCLARAWALAIARAGGRPPRSASLVQLALAELFTDQALPSGGVGGTVLVVAALRRRGVAARSAAVAVVASLLGFYAAQLLAVIAAVLTLSLRRHMIHFSIVVSAIAIAAAVAIPLIVTTAASGLGKLPRSLKRTRAAEVLRETVAMAPREIVLAPRTIVPVAAMRLAIILLDGTTLVAALAAVGHPIPIDEAVAIFVLASVVGSISFLPGGLGSFEALAAGLLALVHVPIEAAVPAILLMRAFSFWLPMLPGLWFARHELRSH